MMVHLPFKADEHKAILNMTMPQFDERWNIVCDSLRHFKMDIEIFSFLFTVTSCLHSYCLLIVFNLIHSLRITVCELQHTDKYVDAIKIISLRIRKKCLTYVIEFLMFSLLL